VRYDLCQISFMGRLTYSFTARLKLNSEFSFEKLAASCIFAHMQLAEIMYICTT
jgi:hypothetical protein